MVKDAACTNDISKDYILNTPLTEETVYSAKVTVTPKTDGTASAANSIGDKNGNCTQDGKKYYAVDSKGVTKDGISQLNLFPVRLILLRNWKMHQTLLKNLTLQLPEQM